MIVNSIHSIKKALIIRYIPLLKTLKTYNWGTFSFDLHSGLIVAILLVPQAIAYSYLAGMPPQYGLYAGLIPIALYSFLGTSPHVAIGPVAISAILILAGVSQLAESFSARYIELTILSGLLIGLVQAFVGLIKKGNLTNFLSYPFLTGFTSAASIIIISSQLKEVLGIKIPKFEFFHESIFSVLYQLKEIHFPTFLMACGSVTFIFISNKISRKIPSGLILVVLGIVFSYFFDFKAQGIGIIGFVPSGLPTFSIPSISILDIIALLPTVSLVSAIGIIESIGIAKTLETKNNFYKINTNQELIAIGISKIGGSFFSALPSSVSYSRSALLHQTKAKTNMASIISVLFVILSLLFLTSFLFFLPKVILAIIIIYAVKNLFEYRLAMKLFKLNKYDFLVMLITFLATLMVRIEIGVAIGFVFSFLMLNTSNESIFKKIGKIFSQNYNDSFYFSNTERDITELELIINENLHFGNVHFLDNMIKRKISNMTSISSINLLFKNCSKIDSNAIMTLREVFKFLDKKEINYQVSNFSSELKNILEESSIILNE